MVKKYKCHYAVSPFSFKISFSRGTISFALNISYFLHGTKSLDLKFFISFFFLEYFPMTFTSSLDQPHAFECLSLLLLTNLMLSTIFHLFIKPISCFPFLSLQLLYYMLCQIVHGQWKNTGLFIMCLHFPSKMLFSCGIISLAVNISYLLHGTKSLNLQSPISFFFSLNISQCILPLHRTNPMLSIVIHLFIRSISCFPYLSLQLIYYMLFKTFHGL